METLTVPAYQNISGDSGVDSYEEGDDGESLSVTFVSGQTYTYTAADTDLANLIGLAQAGSGLSTFIAQNLRHSFSAKAPAPAGHNRPARLRRRAEFKRRAAEAWARLRAKP